MKFDQVNWNPSFIFVVSLYSSCVVALFWILFAWMFILMAQLIDMGLGASLLPYSHCTRSCTPSVRQYF